MNVERIDSIVFDLKQSIEDLSYELKIIAEGINALNKKIELINKEKSHS